MHVKERTTKLYFLNAIFRLSELSTSATVGSTGI